MGYPPFNMCLKGFNHGFALIAFAVISILAGCASENTASRSYPVARASGEPGIVISPYYPHPRVDIHGFDAGELCRNTTTGQVFRVPENAYDDSRASNSTQDQDERGSVSSNGLNAAQERALGNLAGIVITTAFANELDTYDNIFASAGAVFLRLQRVQYISDLIKQAFPDLGEFENRTATRVAGLILNGQLSAENLTEQTIRGEILVQLKQEGSTISQEAQVANFLYLLYRARTR